MFLYTQTFSKSGPYCLKEKTLVIEQVKLKSRRALTIVVQILTYSMVFSSQVTILLSHRDTLCAIMFLCTQISFTCVQACFCSHRSVFALMNIDSDMPSYCTFITFFWIRDCSTNCAGINAIYAQDELNTHSKISFIICCQNCFNDCHYVKCQFSKLLGTCFANIKILIKRQIFVI